MRPLVIAIVAAALITLTSMPPRPAIRWQCGNADAIRM